jgi:hypothetical protein
LFEVKLPKSIKPGDSEDGELKLKEDAYGDAFEKSITIEVVGEDDELTTRFTIPVKRSVHVAKANDNANAGSSGKGTP